MLNLGGLKHVASALGVTQGELVLLLDDIDQDAGKIVRELTVWPINPEKESRDVICPLKRWRFIQHRIYQRLLLPNLSPTKYMHGGVKGRSPATNARAHIGNRFAFVTDVSGFFPSIRLWRVNKVFLEHGCGPEAASVLTRLCTYKFHLAQGLTTSPILANEAFRPVDVDIVRACHAMGLVYTRFVDDITISGKFDLKKSGIESLVRDAVTRHGFAVADEKTDCGRLDRDICITGTRLCGDHINPSRKFMRELSRIMADHASLAANGRFTGPLFVESEVLGKAYYACRLNRGERRNILSQVKKIDWCAAMNNAAQLGLCRLIERVTPRGAPRPNQELPLPLSQGWRHALAAAETGGCQRKQRVRSS
jgi:RNA-directed DNA polymerase